jgi:hypothetical protein
MLYALENQLATALRRVLPQAVQVVVGPPAGPPAATTERVDIVAFGLSVELPQGDPFSLREPAFLTHVQHWSADGATRDFTLPPEVSGEIVEVESPPNHPAKRGEQYMLDGGVVRFYQPPAQATDAVVATVRLGDAQGYQERRPCQAQLTVASWAADFPRVDELLEQALAVVLPGTLEPGTLEAAHLGSSDVRLRMLQPAVLLLGIDRMRTQVGTRWAPSAVARLRLQGQLELSVAIGTPEAVSRIQEIRYKLKPAK